MNKITAGDIKKKKNKEKIIMLTAYDYSFAKILDEAGLDIILVGDSMANVVLGIKQTRRISLTEMYQHTRAVAYGTKRSLVVADMPYSAYQRKPQDCLKHARKFLKLGADAVKIEWFGAKNSKDCFYVVGKLIKNGIPVMGHIGLTPQTVHLLGGYRVQGRSKPAAEELLRQAKILQNLGVFSLVLECIPYPLARKITASLKIPTIGIGAGKYCDGQVLVLYDFLGLYSEKKPRFVRVYRDFSREIKKAVIEFSRDIRKGKFPSKPESFFS
ncbi:MAG: 3-methyl-2-oxobutanoate hydroxymethyltransferase [Candidatus Omnitrophica bacterium]|nr:3-methyl-2-oxobutanoate hydroxymethyltransferase [Candidatus Omnitrophota bacterium]MDD5430232.1 3-methyl-2-oxobutanoate hydroxymethyltransferase [Candidatus Omnitrophota bacterium]